MIFETIDEAMIHCKELNEILKETKYYSGVNVVAGGCLVVIKVKEIPLSEVRISGQYGIFD